MAAAQHMKAWQWVSPGPLAQHLRLTEQAARPSSAALKQGEILVQVARVSLNPADYKLGEVGLAARALVSFPLTAGMDLAGAVAAVGPEVRDVAPGDRVVARIDPRGSGGALAEFAVVQPDGYAPLARDADLDAAAGLGTGGLTAYQSIQPHVRPGARVFINGGAGGTGAYGIQVAKLLGCHVTVTCSPAKAALCRELGADRIIDYRSEDVVAALSKDGPVYDLAVDNVGTSPPYLHASSAAFLRPEAKFVIVAGGASWAYLSQAASALFRPAMLGGGKNKAIMYMTKNSRPDLAQLAQWLGQGKLKTNIDSTFDFTQVVDAYQHLKKGTTAGKVVVHVADLPPPK